MTEEENIREEIDEIVKKKKNKFLKSLDSNMYFKSVFSGDSLSFEWIDQIEFSCPYIDIVVRNPKLTLIKEERVVNAEKSKKVTVESIKDLSKHTNYISKYDEEKNYIEPSKILNIFNEETYNIYENRFLYTLVKQVESFIFKKEQELKDFKFNDTKLLEYSATSKTDYEKVSIELRLNSESFPDDKPNPKFDEEIKVAKARLKRIKDYIRSWNNSELFKELEKAHINLVNSPIKKTNILLKNPNFQIAVKLWDYLQKYDMQEKNIIRPDIEQAGKNPLQDFIDHSFLIDYFVLDSISKKKKDQKEKMSQYAILLLTEEIERTIRLLNNMGINIDEETILNMVAKNLKDEKNEKLIGADDVKKKFKNAMDEYLERMQDVL